MGIYFRLISHFFQYLHSPGRSFSHLRIGKTFNPLIKTLLCFHFPSTYIYVYLGQIYDCKIGICHTIVRQETTENLVGIVSTLFPWTLYPT